MCEGKQILLEQKCYLWVILKGNDAFCVNMHMWQNLEGQWFDFRSYKEEKEKSILKCYAKGNYQATVMEIIRGQKYKYTKRRKGDLANPFDHTGWEFLTA